jgi:peptide deformylase
MTLELVRQWCDGAIAKAPRILLWPNKTLSEQSMDLEVDLSTPEKVADYKATMKDLQDILHQAMVEDNGVGLACIQLGLPLRAFVIARDERDPLKGAELYINPAYTSLTRRRGMNEGCLSFPNQFIDVPRYDAVQAAFLDVDTNPRDVTLSGFVAHAYQHEFDHVIGVTLAELTSPENRSKMRAEAVRNKKRR